MVVRIRQDILDDINGEDGAQTYLFTFDGQQYEIDLVKENHDALVEALAPFVKVARKKGPKRTPEASRPSKSGNPDNAKIREWAVANNIEVPPRGRVPEAVRKAFEAKDPSLLRN